MSTALIFSLFSFFASKYPVIFFPNTSCYPFYLKMCHPLAFKNLKSRCSTAWIGCNFSKKNVFPLYHWIRFKIQNNNRTRYHSPANTIQSKAMKYKFWGTYVIRMSNTRWWVKTHCKTLSWIRNGLNLQITYVELIFKKGSVGIDECFQ